MIFLALRALEHALFYLLIAAVPYVIYHWTGKLFLASVGAVGLLAYCGCWMVYRVGLELWLTGLVLMLIGTIVMATLCLLLDSRSSLSWAVVTFALELALVRAAAVWNPFTKGEEGLVSPFWSTRGWLIGVALTLSWIVLYLSVSKTHLFLWSRLCWEAPKLCKSIGVSGSLARLPVYVFAGFTVGLAAIHYLSFVQRIQPAGFALCNSLVGFAVAFLAPAKTVWPLVAFGLAFVGIRLAAGVFQLPDATQLAEVIAGLGILGYVLGGSGRHFWYGAED